MSQLVSKLRLGDYEAGIFCLLRWNGGFYKVYMKLKYVSQLFSYIFGLITPHANFLWESENVNKNSTSKILKVGEGEFGKRAKILPGS